MPFVDIFQSGLRLPPKVCIVAPGPNGRGRYREIPADCYVIAVSKAVLIPSIRPQLWMMNHTHQDWYRQADAAFHGVRVYGDLASSQVSPPEGETWYSYTAEGSLRPDRVEPIDGCIRIGGSVTGGALQLAYNFGARLILLCGADMSGDDYWDGTANPQPAHGSTWLAASCLNPLIRWLVRERGLWVATLSETQLQVPWYRPREES
jgi:hypothetical protein